jgi:hypothetical protein
VLGLGLVLGLGFVLGPGPGFEWPLRAVLDLNLLVLELVEAVDAGVHAQVEVGPDRVTHMFRLQVDDHVVHLSRK